MNIKRLLGIKRYYVVFYTFSINGKDWGVGDISITNDNGKFVDRNWIIEEVKNIYKGVGTNNIRVSITGWNEMSRKDFNEYILNNTTK